jgi:predicted CxxxxCH...CXXCH cytochrome family protein
VKKLLFGSIIILIMTAAAVVPVRELRSTTTQLVTPEDCCELRVGDANQQNGDEPTIGDVSLMVDALFITGNPDGLPCLPEADINQSGGAEPIGEDITIGDVSLLIDYLFITGSSLGLAECIEPFSPCAGCHGGVDNQTGAPPDGLEGESLITQLAVGAHTAHVEGKLISDGIDCAECHVVPADISAPGHLDGDQVAEVIFGALGGNQSVWDRDNATCSMVYCHGNFSGGNNHTPTWTAANQAECGSCHDVGSAPALLGGRHERHLELIGIDCVDCHAATVNASRQVTGLDVHVNGINDVVFASGVGTWGGGWCTNPACHNTARWEP